MDTLRTNNFVEIESKNNEITRSVWKKQFGGKKKRKTRKTRKTKKTRKQKYRKIKKNKSKRYL